LADPGTRSRKNVARPRHKPHQRAVFESHRFSQNMVQKALAKLGGERLENSGEK